MFFIWLHGLALFVAFVVWVFYYNNVYLFYALWKIYVLRILYKKNPKTDYKLSAENKSWTKFKVRSKIFSEEQRSQSLLILGILVHMV